jgi:hypothetical protein
MASMLDLRAVDLWFEPRPSQTKDYKIGICCFSAKHASLKIISFKKIIDSGLYTWENGNYCSLLAALSKL